MTEAADPNSVLERRAYGYATVIVLTLIAGGKYYGPKAVAKINAVKHADEIAARIMAKHMERIHDRP